MRSKRHSTLAGILGAVLLLNLFMVGLLAYTLDTARERKEAEVRTTVENLALLLDQNVTSSVREIDLTLREIQHHLESELQQRQPLQARQINPRLAEHEQWLQQAPELRITDASGRVRFGHGLTPSTDIDYSDRSFFLAHRGLDDDRTRASHLLMGRISQTWILVFSRRYNHPDGRFAGMITAAVPVSYFQRLLSGLDLGPHGIALMRDLNMALIGRHPSSPLDAAQIGQVGGSPELSALVRAQVTSGTFYSDSTADGINRIDAYRRLSAMPAFVVVGLGEDDYLAQWYEDRNKALLLGLLFLLVTGCSGWLFWRLLNSIVHANQRSRILLQNASDGIHILDAEGRLLEVSDAFCRMLGYPRQQLLQLRVSDWDAQFSATQAAAMIQHLLASGTTQTLETLHRRQDGSLYPAEIALRSVNIDGNRVIFCSARDISERRQAAERLRIAAIAFDSQVGMFITDAAGHILQVNRAFTAITGYAAAECCGSTPAILSSGRHDRQFFSDMWQTISQTGAWQGEIWNQRKNGEIYPQMLSIGAVRDDAGQITHYVASLIDISASKSSEEQIRALAYFDPLTGLPNRRQLLEQLEHALRSCERHATQGALLLVNLDNFKAFNDTAGHNRGDQLLEQVAQRLRECVREGTSLARLAGDEFVVMLDDAGSRDIEAATQAEALGARILAALSRPYAIGEAEYRGSASVGIALFGRGANESVDEPLKRADMAILQAKTAGPNSLRFFDPQMEARVHARVELEAGLRVALEQGQLALHYQPQVAAGHGIIGVEALLRWQHPQRGNISPADFIPVAEETGLILPLGRWVLQTACAQLAAWAEQPGRESLSIAVNVSPNQFAQADFVDELLQILKDSGANPQRLKLELTESSLLADVEQIIARMDALKAHGVCFSLDDFGTGYSSLAYLKRLPLDQLKIDQGFVRDILIDPNDAAIARMTIALAGSLGIAVIAEGVEQEAQRAFLAEQGCLLYQGYLFGRPQPLTELEATLAAQPRPARAAL